MLKTGKVRTIWVEGNVDSLVFSDLLNNQIYVND